MFGERIVIFTDGSNLWHGANQLKEKIKLDMIRLRDFLTNGRNLIRSYYYGSFELGNKSQELFHRFLELNGYDVRVKPLRERGKRKIEKGADVMLVTDMLSLAMKDAFDTAVVISGDADFVGAIEEVKRTGKRVEVACFNGITSFDIKKSADMFVNLDDYQEEIKDVRKQ